MKSLLSASAALFLACGAHADLVFEADFNGTGSRTGGPSDIVALGGTGVISNENPKMSQIDASISKAAPLVAGGGSYLSLSDKGAQAGGTRLAGVLFSPASTANSFDSWYSDTSGKLGFDALNGSFEFLFRTSSGQILGKDAFRFFDIGSASSSSSGYRLALSSVPDGKLSLALNENGKNIARATSSRLPFAPNTTCRLVGTISTDPGGRATLSLYLAEAGKTAFRLIATATTGVLDADNRISKSFGSDAGFGFGATTNATDDIKVLDLDTFRIYNSIPAEFTSRR